MSPAVGTLVRMSTRSIWSRTLSLGVAAVLMTLTPSAALAAPSSATSRSRVDEAVSRFESARRRSESTDARVRGAADELDRTVAEETATRARLTARVSTMYRSGETGLISVLLGASSFEEFATRWDLLVRLGREDAAALIRLRELHAREKRTLASLLTLQEQQARAEDALAREATQARNDFARSQAALAEYNARTSKAASKLVRTKAPARQPKGSGAWKTAVASHYGRNFTGRGANGEEIGPYSMIVAHRTLPFGTLIEFEYKGKRAVARVTDRGPHVAGREFDLGPGVVRVLDFSGVDEVRYRIIKR